MKIMLGISNNTVLMIVLYIAGIILVYYTSKLLKSIIIGRIGPYKPSIASMLGVLINVFAAVIASILAFDLVKIFYPEIGQVSLLLAYAAGAITVILGLAAQNSLGHIIAGMVLVFSQAIRVGDVVEYNGMLARVEDISLTHTRLVTLDGKRVIIPNQLLLNSDIVNYSVDVRDGRPVAAVVDVGISYESNVELAIKAMLEAAYDHPRVLRAPHPIVVVTGFGENSVNLRLYAYIATPWLKPIVESDLVVEIHKRFKEYGIEIPYPRRVLLLHGQQEVDTLATNIMSSSGEVES